MSITPSGDVPVACATVAWRSEGEICVTAVVKAAFAYHADGTVAPVAPQPVVLADQYHQDDPRRSLRASSEIAPFLPNAEVLIVGHAYAPPGQPMASVDVRLVVSRADRPLIDKALRVQGDRVGASPGKRPPPAPFQHMPLLYERAARSAEENPVGLDLAATAEPNVAYPVSRARAAGFGPIARHWPARRNQLRQLDPRRVEGAMLDLPNGFDFGFFQAAPKDQRTGTLRGDEEIALVGLHPTAARVAIRLPAFLAVARVHGLSDAQPPEVVSLRPDTVVIDVDRQTCSVIWRGHFQAPEARLPLLRIAAGLERPPPKAEPLAPVRREALNLTRDASASPRAPALPFQGPPAVKEAPAPQFQIPVAPHLPVAISIEADNPWEEEGDHTRVLARPALAPSAPIMPFARPKVPVADSPPSSVRPGAGLPFTPPRSEPPPPSVEVAPVVATAPRPVFDVAPQDDEPTIISRLPFEGEDEDARATLASDDADGEAEALDVDELRSTGESPRDLLPRPVIPFEPPTARRLGEGARALVTSRGEWPVVRPPEPVVAAPAPAALADLVDDDEQAMEPGPDELIEDDLEEALPLPTDAPLAPSPDATKISEALRAAGLGDDQVSAMLLAIGAKSPAADRDPAVRARVVTMLEQGEPLDGMDLDGADLSDVDFEGCSLAAVTLRGAKLRGARLAGVNLFEADLSGADLEGAVLDTANLEEADLSGADLTNASLCEVSLRGADLSDVHAEGARFTGARGAGAKLAGARLAGASFENADLPGADLARASIEGADFTGAALPDLSLYDARGAGAKFERARLPNLRADGADLTRAALGEIFAPASVWEKARLDEATFTGAVLIAATFARASCTRANFAGADLSQANMRRAKLTSGCFANACLKLASLDRADLSSADLAGADLTGVEIWKAKLDGASMDDGAPKAKR